MSTVFYGVYEDSVLCYKPNKLAKLICVNFLLNEGELSGRELVQFFGEEEIPKLFSEESRRESDIITSFAETQLFSSKNFSLYLDNAYEPGEYMLEDFYDVMQDIIELDNVSIALHTPEKKHVSEVDRRLRHIGYTTKREDNYLAMIYNDSIKDEVLEVCTSILSAKQ